MQVCKYAHICKYANMQVCTHMQVWKYAIMQVSKYASMQVCKYASMQVCKYASMLIYINKCLNLIVFKQFHRDCLWNISFPANKVREFIGKRTACYFGLALPRTTPISRLGDKQPGQVWILGNNVAWWPTLNRMYSFTLVSDLLLAVMDTISFSVTGL